MSKLPTPALLEDERILWEGRAYPWIMFHPIDWFLIPFSILWAGLVVYLFHHSWSLYQDIFSKLISLFMLGGGMYFTFGRFVIDAFIRSKIVYFVTSRRVIIINAWDERTTWFEISCLPHLELVERPDSFGTIRFDKPTGWWTGNFKSSGFEAVRELERDTTIIWQPVTDPTPRFIRIPNARSVYELIRSQMGR